MKRSGRGDAGEGERQRDEKGAETNATASIRLLSLTPGFAGAGSRPTLRCEEMQWGEGEETNKSRTSELKAIKITILGGGIVGLWQALTLAKLGAQVELRDTAATPFSAAASRLAGAMLAPYCEGEAAEPIIQSLGLSALPIWRRTFPGTIGNGSLVVAAARDQGELARFARMTQGHQQLDGAAVAALEPDLADRFGRALYYAEEAHVPTRAAMQFLMDELGRLGVVLRIGVSAEEAAASGSNSANAWTIDCRGLGARGDLSELRGVRGEMAVLRTNEVHVSRPVRLLHPRFPLYVVPWGEGQYMVGATVLEREDAGPVTARSALDLLGAAYAVHPAFGEAEILELSAGVRPAFPDNVPRIIVRGRRIFVNGLYRHGFLLSPILAELVAKFVSDGAADCEIFRVE